MKKNIKWIVGALCAISMILITSLYGMNVWQRAGYGTQSQEEKALIDELKRIEGATDPEEEVVHLSTAQLTRLLAFLKDNKLETAYPIAFNELSARQLMRHDLQETQRLEEIERFNSAAVKGEISFVNYISDSMKQDITHYIQKFRDDTGNQHAYQELYAALHPQERKTGIYPTTEMAEIKTAGYPPIMAHIINLNAIELQSTTCIKDVSFTMPLEEVAELFGGEIPENYDELGLIKEKRITTICKELTKKQKGNECGIMSVYNAIQLYNLLTGRISKAQFEQALMTFNGESWQQDVLSCPIDLADITTLLRKHAPQLNAMQYTIIPTLVDDTNHLSYTPAQRKMIVVEHDGSVSATFDQDTALLHAIEAIRNPQITTYIHLFFLNNLQVSGRGAAMRHWIPAVLYKQHNQVYLYVVDSQNVYYEDTLDPSEKVVDMERLKHVVEKDNGWLRALIHLLSINPQALKRALGIANSIASDDYNHNYAADILRAVAQDNSDTARDIRTLFSPR